MAWLRLAVAIDWAAELQPLVDEAIKHGGPAVSLGVAGDGFAAEVVGGVVDALAPPGSPAVVGDQWAWGSVTKTFTGAGILQLVDQGKVRLDDPAHKYIDPMLQKAKAPYPTLEELFQADRWGIAPEKSFNATDITLRHLLSMLSGVPVFDTDAYRDFQYRHKEDMSPVDILDWVHGPLAFQPGGPLPPSATHSGFGGVGINYCSVNFILLGYVLAYFAGADSWDAYDQASVVPPPVRDAMEGLSFPLHGPCSAFTRVHGFDNVSAWAPYDVSETSCLGGWSAGNVVMPGKAAAQWAHALYGGAVVSKAALEEMFPKPKHFYGLATMDLSWAVTNTTAYGHLGDTYGFGSYLLYFPEQRFGLAVASNREQDGRDPTQQLLCTAYHRVKDLLAGEAPRECKVVYDGYHSECTCKPRAEPVLV